MSDLDIRGDFFDGEIVECWFGPNLLETFWRKRTGASRATLERRARYGGRKARSASRRLNAGEHQHRAVYKHFERRYALQAPGEVPK